jgi:hypothetical protein
MTERSKRHLMQCSKIADVLSTCIGPHIDNLDFILTY